MTVPVRPGVSDDLAAVALLERECFPDDPWQPTYLRAALAGELPTISLLVAGGAGADLVGYAIVSTVFEVAELQRIGTLPAARRGGVGRALLAGVVEAARADGVERLLLEVREHNLAAAALYREAGFGEIDRRERYYRDGTTAIVLQLELARGA